MPTNTIEPTTTKQSETSLAKLQKRFAKLTGARDDLAAQRDQLEYQIESDRRARVEALADGGNPKPIPAQRDELATMADEVADLGKAVGLVDAMIAGEQSRIRANSDRTAALATLKRCGDSLSNERIQAEVVVNASNFARLNELDEHAGRDSVEWDSADYLAKLAGQQVTPKSAKAIREFAVSNARCKAIAEQLRDRGKPYHPLWVRGCCYFEPGVLRSHLESYRETLSRIGLRI